MKKCSTSLAIREMQTNNEISSHPSQNCNHQENAKQMVRMWGVKKNNSLLVGMFSHYPNPDESSSKN
jgi:hypothetical protein